MSYKIILSKQAIQGQRVLQRSEPAAAKKLNELLLELREHPYTGTGQIEQLRNFPEPTWSRRISRKHRLVYRIYDENVQVLVITVYGHYGDK
ncbi:MAG: Txe/YoeB family addiction module toxin [Bacteroidales bacterium]|nr:Txe/YoeB family addiction module toxin [Bacteroidales bacterium]MCD8393237.1 Txe/YoeB family addiction module toxin [Bacteroidales bacterium]